MRSKFSQIAMSVLAISGAVFSASAVFAQAEGEVVAEPAPLTHLAIVEHFADLGHLTYLDSVQSAETLRDDVRAFLDEPTEESFEQVRASWQTARVVYKQAEVFRYSSPITATLAQRVDNWPVDEGFLDYVDESYIGAQGNALASQNVLANNGFVTSNSAQNWDIITSEVIADQMHQAGGRSENVAAGYQAIEFMLWGQDTSLEEAGDGSRTITEFSSTDCPDQSCVARSQFLSAAVELLIEDLSKLANRWAPNGAARAVLVEHPDRAIVTILSALGAVARAELVENNLQKGLLSGSAEMESDAFSDYSHAAYLLTARGVMNTYLGDYFTLDGNVSEGASIADLVAEADPELDRTFRVTLSKMMARMRTFLRYVRDEEPLDSIFVNKSEQGITLIGELVDALNEEAESLEKIAAILGLGPLDFSLPPFEMAMLDLEEVDG